MLFGPKQELVELTLIRLISACFFHSYGIKCAAFNAMKSSQANGAAERANGANGAPSGVAEKDAVFPHLVVSSCCC